MPPHFALMFISSIAGSLVQAVCGFGYGPVNMSVMPYLLPYLQAVTLSGLCGSTTSLMVVLTSWRHVNLRILLPCAVTGVLTGMAAVQISAGARDALMMHCLGAGLIVLGIYSLSPCILSSRSKTCHHRVRPLCSAPYYADIS